MADEYLQGKSTKNKSAESFDSVFEEMSVFFSDGNADIREQKSYKANDYNGNDNGICDNR